MGLARAIVQSADNPAFYILRVGAELPADAAAEMELDQAPKLTFLKQFPEALDL